jgi:hypothetical protein
MSGDDVLGVKYGLKRTPFGKPVRLNRNFRVGMVVAVKAFQKHHGLRADGQVGPKTYDALRPHIPPYGCWLLGHYHIPLGNVRDRIVKEALFLASHSPSIHYTQGSLRWSGINGGIKPPNYPHYADCSSLATYCYWVAGAPDPNGLNFRAGYTGTMAAHGRRVDAPRPGDLVLYGRGPTYEHVAVYIGGGRVISHGSESGPLNLPVHYRGDFAQYRSYV